ncbi:AAA family ATPase [Rugamonas rivuli]|uniref:AAA family ATPase n=1 Tax=Rugamonas rivuli TaxID=2743358 RepID=A0A843SN76_9BURK|nr:ATP-binding protein [Rugamonas rivuli]MQA23643.1 AAA family ATPase [Rugamonas rivuli]
MINSIVLRFGRSPGQAGEEIAVTPLTVFVGPNNSGKSKFLAELQQYCRTGQKDANSVILAGVGFSGLTLERAESVTNDMKSPVGQGEILQPDHMFVGSRYGRQQIHLPSYINALQMPTGNLAYFCSYYLVHKTLWLGGADRINLVADQGGGDLQNIPQTSLQILFRNDAMRSEVRRIVAEAFGTYFVIDPTSLGTLRIRLSSRPPADKMEERGLHAEAVSYHAQAKLIVQASDGVKAFTGIITEVIAGDPDVILIDEPEAFLHPALAAKLGLEIAGAARNAVKRVFVSTHSPTFLMGCIQSNVPTNIIRLTHRGGVSTARVLPSDEILTLMRHPLLRSTGVLSGLFYEFVVVTESDADRAFYQEVNERLNQYKPEWGIPNCLFLNAQNKQTIPTIVGPLRRLGIPVASIVDVDVLKDGGAVWTTMSKAAHIPDLLQTNLGAMRAGVKRAMEATGRDMKRDGGVKILDKDDQESALSLLDQLATYGVFVIPNGELESWLQPLEAKGHGPVWLIDIFEKMGGNPGEQDYVKPENGDVWQFLAKVKAWLTDSERRGIPE